MKDQSPPDDLADLAAELRRLRLDGPSPALRRRALAAAPPERQPFFAHWWRELALAATALLIFNVSLPASLPAIAFPTWPLAPQPTAAQVQAASASLADQLGVSGMAAYFEKKTLAGALASGPAPTSRNSNSNDPS